jgi:hypothetical protein
MATNIAKVAVQYECTVIPSAKPETKEMFSQSLNDKKKLIEKTANALFVIAEELADYMNEVGLIDPENDFLIQAYFKGAPETSEVIEEIYQLFKEHGSATIENKVDFTNALILKLKTLTTTRRTNET